jgi:hypothetical protein
MCEFCNEFYKTKQELQNHSLSCSMNGDLSIEKTMDQVVSIWFEVILITFFINSFHSYEGEIS